MHLSTDPTETVEPTIGTVTSIVDNPTRSKDTDTVKLIDVGGNKKSRDQTWPQYYNQVHGLIFVLDASNQRRFRDNKETLETLLQDDDLKGKPVLM